MIPVHGATSVLGIGRRAVNRYDRFQYHWGWGISMLVFTARKYILYLSWLVSLAAGLQ